MSKTYNVVHTIKLVTEFNLDHPSTKNIVSMPQEQLEQICQGAFIGMAKQQGWLDQANESGSWAILRFAEDGE